MKQSTRPTVCLLSVLSCITVIAPWLTERAEAQPPVERLVEFRDGTLLRMRAEEVEVPWQRITSDGQMLDEPFNFGEIAEIQFATSTITERLLQIRQWLVELSDDDYFVRQRAQESLIEHAAMFRPVLEAAQELAIEKNDEPDFLWRIEEVLGELPRAPKLDQQYDAYVVAADAEEQLGDVGDWSVNMTSRGQTLSIDRRNAARIRLAEEESSNIDAPLIGGWRRIEEDLDELFPLNVIRVAFETDSQGRNLEPGVDLSRRFVDQGFTMDTSIEGAIVSVERYNVRGRSGGQCATTHDPIYEGELTIRFCEPGNGRVAAGVHYVGFWTAYIVRDGTALEAYDSTGRPVAIIKTQRNTRDFLAIKSTVPIAYIKIVPDIEIDPNFAIDDLVFDPPVPLAESADDSKYTLHLSTGERVKARQVEITADEFILHNVSVGWDRLAIDRSEVVGYFPPYDGWEIQAEEDDCFVMLRDGSIVRAAAADGGLVIRREGMSREISQDDLTATWGTITYFEMPDEETWPEGGAVMLREGEENTLLPTWQIGEHWIEAGELDELEFDYSNSPIIWFDRPEDIPPGSGRLRLTNGEEFVLAPDVFQIEEWTAEQITLRYHDREVAIPAGEVISLIFPSIEVP